MAIVGGIAPDRPLSGRRRAPRRGGRFPFALVAFILLVLGSLALPFPAPAQDPVSANPIDVLKTYAEVFMADQANDGSYMVTPNVQTHLKAEIAMALAADLTRRRDILGSARRDLDWVLANRMEADGGLNWNGPLNPNFFECHQHWFLIASELIRRQQSPPTDDPLKNWQSKAWMYLLRDNPAHADFYKHNRDHHGVFFGYRSVDRNGGFQLQANFKGSYEVGAALWSMALHRRTPWLLALSPGGNDTTMSPASYLAQMVPQIVRPLSDHGFFDSDKQNWIRSVLWNGGQGWTGFEPHDWKYAPHMQEGALLYCMYTGHSDLLGPARMEAEKLLSAVLADGEIRGIPDGNGTAAYEYGTALACLGLGARVFWLSDPALGNRCFEAGQRVFQYASRTFPPMSSEDRAILLAGYCRIIEAGRDAHDVVWGGLETDTTIVINSPVSLVAWPNPMSDHIQFLYTVPQNTAGLLKIIDATGRLCCTMTLRTNDLGKGELRWDGLDEECRRLPSGHYQAVLQSGGRKKITGFAILR
jgi:hypothetical protein